MVNIASSQDELNGKMAQEQKFNNNFDDASTQAQTITANGSAKPDMAVKLGLNQ